jgi:O-antigen/teichoic acid export membrane protein
MSVLQAFDSLWGAVKPILPFLLSIPVTSSIWILITQTDKLILSKLLSLTEYGYFTLAAVAASGIMMISSPISSALIPRMAKLKAEGDEKGLIAVYRHATQLVAMIVVPTTLVLCFYLEQLLKVWTGNSLASQAAAPGLRLYALGNGILAFTAFPYYLQYAHGKMKLHLIGNCLFVFLRHPLYGLLFVME